MPTATNIDLGVFGLASVDRIRFTITKDGVAWTGIDSIELTFEGPDRSTQFTRDMTVEDDSSGIWYYDTAVTDFDDADADTGHWTLGVEVTDGSIVKRYPGEIGFYVGDEP